MIGLINAIVCRIENSSWILSAYLYCCACIGSFDFEVEHQSTIHVIAKKALFQTSHVYTKPDRHRWCPPIKCRRLSLHFPGPFPVRRTSNVLEAKGQTNQQTFRCRGEKGLRKGRRRVGTWIIACDGGGKGRKRLGSMTKPCQSRASDKAPGPSLTRASQTGPCHRC